MKLHARAAVLAIFLGAAAWASGEASKNHFMDGDRWCAVGDSITHNGSYHAWTWLYYLTRFPERVVEPSNAGLSGDSAAGGLRRLEWDILPNKPTVATVLFGMNDVGRRLYETPSTPEIEQERRDRLSAYRENQRALVKALQAAGARVILLTPSLFDQTAESERPRLTGVNDALAECASFLAALGAETGASVIDLHGPMSRLNSELQRTDAKVSIVGADRVHPGPPGHLLMAYLLLRGQGAPADVARLTLDAKTRRMVSAVNGRASDVRRRKRGLSFTWEADALPFPVPAEAALALEWVPFVSDLNQEILQVTGLAAGRYSLRIDEDEPLGPFSAEELARGLNLADHRTTPQYRQALAVAERVEARRRLVAERLRALALIEHRLTKSGLPPGLEQMKPLVEEQLALFKATPPAAVIQRAMEAYLDVKPRQAEIAAEAARTVDEARRAARPRPHNYVLTAVE